MLTGVGDNLLLQRMKLVGRVALITGAPARWCMSMLVHVGPAAALQGLARCSRCLTAPSWGTLGQHALAACTQCGMVQAAARA